jgi:chaperonin GroEL
VLYEALGRPVRAIADNAGFDGDVVAHRALQNKNANYGFDSLKGEYCDLLQTGIVDPLKVTRAALQNASSVAALLLTTDALIATKREPKKKGGGKGMEGMDDMEGMGDMGGMGGMGGMDF